VILHQIQPGTVEITTGETKVQFDMPNGETMHVDIHGTADPRVMAAYAYLFANIPFMLREPIAYLHMVGQKCNVELL
jgi:hypothetical protein